jgi:hypothetical protein
MRSSSVVAIALAAQLVGAALWVGLRCTSDPTKPVVAAPVAEQVPSDAGQAAPLDASVPEAPWMPPGKACRASVARGVTFAEIPDAILAAAILENYDPDTRRFRATRVVDQTTVKYVARDCRGERIEYEHPLSEEQKKSPPAAPYVDPDEDTGLVRIERHDVRDGRMAVYTALSLRYGFYFSCVGFQAIVRLEEQELVVEGVGPADLDGCGEKGNELHLTSLGGRMALLLPVSTGTGENGNASSEWRVYLAERGALRHVGAAPHWQSAGNGTLRSGRWFGNMDAKVLDAGALTIEETWRFVRYETTGADTRGPTRTVVRFYGLSDDGGLARSPASDPSP